MSNTPLLIKSQKTHESRFQEVTGISLDDVYSSKSYNPRNISNPHIGLRNGLIFHINKLVKDRFDAEVIADDVLTKVIFDKLDTYDSEMANFPTWMFQIGKHEALAHINRYRNKKTETQKFVSIDEDHNGMCFADFLSEGEALDTISAAERDRLNELRYELVKNAMFDIDERKSTALVMRLLDGLKYKEITEYTGENENTIKSRIKQGKVAVQKAVRVEMRLLNKLTLE